MKNLIKDYIESKNGKSTILGYFRMVSDHEEYVGYRIVFRKPRNKPENCDVSIDELLEFIYNKINNQKL